VEGKHGQAEGREEKDGGNTGQRGGASKLHGKLNLARRTSEEGVKDIRAESDRSVYPVWSSSKPGLGWGDQHSGHHIKGVVYRRTCLWYASMSELKSEGCDVGLKPAVLSFQDERTRLEWPKKRRPIGRIKRDPQENQGERRGQRRG
jgi:hypothetical protein